jgi:hypothetical protein
MATIPFALAAPIIMEPEIMKIRNRKAFCQYIDFIAPVNKYLNQAA